MKKYFAFLVMMLPLLAACDDEDENGNSGGNGGGSTEITLSTVAGEWYMTTGDSYSSEEESMTFNKDGSCVMLSTSYSYVNSQKVISRQDRMQGTFTLDGNEMDIHFTKSEYKESIWNEAGEYQGLTDWTADKYFDPEEDGDIDVDLKLISGGSVVIVTQEYEYDGTEYTESMMFFKKGASLPSDRSVLNGTWYWYEQGSDNEVRLAIKFDGSNADMVITPWGERYVGSYTYKNGTITISNTTFYTSRTNDGNLINWQDPYSSGWNIPDENSWNQGNFEGDISFPFVVDGNNAYSMFVGLSPIYVKQ